MRGEILATFLAMLNGASHLETSITNRLQFAYLTKHRAHFIFCLIRQPFVAYLLQILTYFYLHVVGNILVLADTGKQVIELTTIFFVKQNLRHAKHALHSLGKMDNLLLRLKNGYFWSCHQSTLNIA